MYVCMYVCNADSAFSDSRVFGSPLRFNTSNWFQDQNVVIMAVDDDIIMESPYGAVIGMESFSPRPDFVQRSNLTLVITELDRGEQELVNGCTVEPVLTAT